VGWGGVETWMGWNTYEWAGAWCGWLERMWWHTSRMGSTPPQHLHTQPVLSLCRRDGQQQLLPPVSNRRAVDFGAGVGTRSVYLYNLPEVTSGHQVGAVGGAAECQPWCVLGCLPGGLHSVYQYNLPEVTSGHQVGAGRGASRAAAEAMHKPHSSRPGVPSTQCM